MGKTSKVSSELIGTLIATAVGYVIPKLLDYLFSFKKKDAPALKYEVNYPNAVQREANERTDEKALLLKYFDKKI